MIERSLFFRSHQLLRLGAYVKKLLLWIPMVYYLQMNDTTIASEEEGRFGLGTNPEERFDHEASF